MLQGRPVARVSADRTVAALPRRRAGAARIRDDEDAVCMRLTRERPLICSRRDLTYSKMESGEWSMDQEIVTLALDDWLVERNCQKFRAGAVNPNFAFPERDLGRGKAPKWRS
jgi:hypothetical protein